MATYHNTMPTAVSDTPGDLIPFPTPQAPAALLAVAAQLREEALRIRRVSDALAQRPPSERGEGRVPPSAQARLARLRDLQEQSHQLHEQIEALVAVLEGRFGHAAEGMPGAQRNR